jgi:hypothetical protein
MDDMEWWKQQHEQANRGGDAENFALRSRKQS